MNTTQKCAATETIEEVLKKADREAFPALAPWEPEAEPRPTTGGAKPPADGLCRNCKRRVALNRFKLCYPCWVEAEIIDREKKEGREWKPGEAHPSWCHCEGLGEHRLASGADRGAN